MSKCKALSIQFKVKIIKEYEKNILQSKKKLTARFNLPESTLKQILKNKNMIVLLLRNKESRIFQHLGLVRETEKKAWIFTPFHHRRKRKC